MEKKQADGYSDDPLTHPEVDDMVRHLQYEIESFLALARFEVPRAEVHQASPVVRNALRESLLIHARCLTDFLSQRPTRDDLVARHYVPDWDPEADGGAELLWLKRDLDRYINKRVAHLTGYRVRVPTEKEPHTIGEIVDAMTRVLTRFRDRLPPELRERIFS